MFYYQTFCLLRICSKLDCSQQIPGKKIGGQRARLREKENLFRYQAQFEGNLLRFARARAHVRPLMTRKSCAVGMRNGIPRNYLKSKVSTVVSSRFLKGVGFQNAPPFLSCFSQRTVPITSDDNICHFGLVNDAIVQFLDELQLI